MDTGSPNDYQRRANHGHTDENLIEAMETNECNMIYILFIII